MASTFSACLIVSPMHSSRLRLRITAQRPSRWDIHARCAVQWAGKSLTLPAGTWLLALLDLPDSPQPHPPHYRLANGRIVSLEKPLCPYQA